MFEIDTVVLIFFGVRILHSSLVLPSSRSSSFSSFCILSVCLWALLVHGDLGSGGLMDEWRSEGPVRKNWRSLSIGVNLVSVEVLRLIFFCSCRVRYVHISLSRSGNQSIRKIELLKDTKNGRRFASLSSSVSSSGDSHHAYYWYYYRWSSRSVSLSPPVLSFDHPPTPPPPPSLGGASSGFTSFKTIHPGAFIDTHTQTEGGGEREREGEERKKEIRRI